MFCFNAILSFFSDQFTQSHHILGVVFHTFPYPNWFHFSLCLVVSLVSPQLFPPLFTTLYSVLLCRPSLTPWKDEVPCVALNLPQTVD